MKKNIKKAFTLVELLVAITITSLVLASIVEVFIFSSNFEKKVDISRIMQENIKNFTEIISEDIRINKIEKKDSNLYYSGNTLTTSSGSIKTEYYLAQYDNNSYTKVNDINDCKNTNCILVRKIDNNTEPLINSWVSFEDLHFYTSTGTIDGTNGLAKVTMTFTIKPAIKKGISKKVIKKSKIHYQTTFSKRMYKYK